MTAGPIKLIRNGIVAFAGEADPAPSGGLPPVQANYHGNAVTVADDAAAALTWDSFSGSVDLLDRSTPDAPTFITAGTYAVLCVIEAAASLTPGGFVAASLAVGPALTGADTNEHPDWDFSISATAVVAAGDLLAVNVRNKDGAVSADLRLASANVVKLA